MMYLTILSTVLALLCTSGSVFALPTNSDVRQSNDKSSDGSSSNFCSETKCQEGSAEFNSSTELCVCPHWTNQDPRDPCGFVQCPETTEVYFSSSTNQCICKVKNIIPVLIHQATEQIAQRTATVYSVNPYFQDGVLSFLIQLAGSPSGFNLNASTTIAAGTIGTDPEPNLVLVPKNIKTRVPKSAQETAQIIAVTFTSDDTITYHVKLSNGADVTLRGDKYVHDIDLIDPSMPSSLSILTRHGLSNVNRDLDVTHEEIPPVRFQPIAVAKRGVEDISTYTAAVSEDTCGTMKCLNNGGKPAMFNRFLMSCYCETPVLFESGPKNEIKRSDSDVREDLSRQKTAESFIRSVPWITKASPETCRQMIVCRGESQPYFDPTTKQCLCVVYRPGIKEPVITSNSRILPRDELIVNPRVQSGDHSSFWGGGTDWHFTCTEYGAECQTDPYRYRCGGPNKKFLRFQVNEVCEQKCECQEVLPVVPEKCSTTGECAVDWPLRRGAENAGEGANENDEAAAWSTDSSGMRCCDMAYR